MMVMSDIEILRVGGLGPPSLKDSLDQDLIFPLSGDTVFQGHQFGSFALSIDRYYYGHLEPFPTGEDSRGRSHQS